MLVPPNFPTSHIFRPPTLETLGPINSTASFFLSDAGRRLTDVSGDSRETIASLSTSLAGGPALGSNFSALPNCCRIEVETLNASRIRQQLELTLQLAVFIAAPSIVRTGHYVLLLSFLLFFRSFGRSPPNFHTC